MDEVCCAAAVHAGLRCNLLAPSTSVATVQRSALVQILERFAMPPKKRPAGSQEDGVNRSFLQVWLPEIFACAGAKTKSR